MLIPAAIEKTPLGRSPVAKTPIVRACPRRDNATTGNARSTATSNSASKGPTAPSFAYGLLPSDILVPPILSSTLYLRACAGMSTCRRENDRNRCFTLLGRILTPDLQGALPLSTAFTLDTHSSSCFKSGAAGLGPEDGAQVPLAAPSNTQMGEQPLRNWVTRTTAAVP